jgi:ABC-type uncharacterized transport system involved in gliding motility auxiliary subunit
MSPGPAKAPATRKSLLLQQAVSAVLFVAVLAMLGWLSTRYKLEADWTYGNRNTLTEASQKFLGTLAEPIRFTVFLYPRSELRQSLEADFARYQRFKKDIVVEFVDPTSNPQKVKDYNVSRAGEVVLEYQGRRENLSTTTEQAITTALQRLAATGERWIVFLEGHGEHALTDTEQSGYSEFAQLLRDKGLKVRTLNLATSASVPDNTAALVIGGPAKPLLAGETKILAEYVQRGGNLLWLADPPADRADPEASLDALSKALNLTWLKGTGILLESAALGLPPFVYITTQYPENPVTRDFPENALFPLVRGLNYKSGDGWDAKPLLTTSDQAWLETGELSGELAAEPEKGDTKGPLTLGVTLTRDVKPAAAEAKPAEGADKATETASDKAIAQRIAVIGDSDFISNGYFSQLGNSLLGLNLAQWLAARDAQLNIDVPKAPDRSLMIPGWGLYAIYVGFAFLLPASLLGFGVARWVVRRRK